MREVELRPSFSPLYSWAEVRRRSGRGVAVQPKRPGLMLYCRERARRLYHTLLRSKEKKAGKTNFQSRKSLGHVREIFSLGMDKYGKIYIRVIGSGESEECI